MKWVCNVLIYEGVLLKSLALVRLITCRQRRWSEQRWWKKNEAALSSQIRGGFIHQKDKCPVSYRATQPWRPATARSLLQNCVRAILKSKSLAINLLKPSLFHALGAGKFVRNERRMYSLSWHVCTCSTAFISPIWYNYYSSCCIKGIHCKATIVY